MLILVGFLLVIVITALTGYFVAQEFGYVAVDRSRLRQQADAGDEAAQRALKVTERLSFMLSGAQLGITVTALIASGQVGATKGLVLHAVDAVGLVHAMILRIQALLLPIQTLVFSGH